MHLIEIEDHPWCPRAVRDGVTDWLGFMANATKAYNAVAPKIRAAMSATRTTSIVDLCSGGGGPWLTLERELAASGPVRVELTDLYPNLDAFESIHEQSGGRCTFRRESIDATDVPVGLDGVRTMFTAFHHFPPDLARAIIADAVRKRRAIAIFEPVDQRVLPLLVMPLQIMGMAMLTPFVRPFTWSRLVLTYVVPLIPFIVFFDGTVSVLRIYSLDELRELVEGIPGHETFDWDIGTTKLGPLPVGITHLVGTPRAA